MRREIGPEDGVERGVEDQDGVALGERDGGGWRRRWRAGNDAEQRGRLLKKMSWPITRSQKTQVLLKFNDVNIGVNMPFLFVSIGKLDGAAYPITR
jgi:hypothetical protein